MVEEQVDEGEIQQTDYLVDADEVEVDIEVNEVDELELLDNDILDEIEKMCLEWLDNEVEVELDEFELLLLEIDDSIEEIE